MHLSDETKEKLKKALPWVIGGAVVLFIVIKMQSGKSRQTGSAPVQDLSSLGGGGGAPVMSGPQQVPQDIASQFAQNQQDSNSAWGALNQQWQQLGNQNGNSILGAWKWDPAQGVFVGIKGGRSGNLGKALTEQQAELLGPQNRGPYAQGQSLLQKLGSFVGSALKGYQTGGLSLPSFGGGVGHTGPGAGNRPFNPAEQQANFPVQVSGPYDAGQAFAQAAQRGMVPTASGAQRQRGRTTRPI